VYKARILTTLVVILAVAASIFTGTPASAQDKSVTLLSNDGTLRLNGEMVDFSDGFYSIKTILGDMRISASRFSCEGPGCPAIETATVSFKISGSDTVGEGLMPLLISGYAAWKGAEAQITNGSRPGQMIAELVSESGFGDEIGSYLVESTSSGDAFAGLLDKSAEIGMSSRRITRDEARALRKNGAGNMVGIESERVIAVDSLVVITHPDNPVKSLSISQLASIYRGETTNWSDVGGPAQPINVYTSVEGSGTRSEFDRGVFGGDPPAPVAGQKVVASATEMANAIDADPSGIGYVGYAFQRGNKPLDIVNHCGITASPNAFAAKTEEYTLNRRLYLYSRDDNLSSAAKDFLEYAISEGADGVVAKSGFINLAVERQSQDNTGGRMRDLITNTTDTFELGLMRELLLEMLQWDRLSTTFRFAPGAFALDNKAELDMVRLLNYLRAQPAGTEVAIVGFTDSDGAFEANRSLSIGRARSVAAAIDAAAAADLTGIKFFALGFGELSPVACNDTQEGKAINRRVEVWIRNAG
jgi:phosphate transport system substrate-binding protein